MPIYVAVNVGDSLIVKFAGVVYYATVGTVPSSMNGYFSVQLVDRHGDPIDPLLRFRQQKLLISSDQIVKNNSNSTINEMKFGPGDKIKLFANGCIHKGICASYEESDGTVRAKYPGSTMSVCINKRMIVDT